MITSSALLPYVSPLFRIMGPLKRKSPSEFTVNYKIDYSFTSVKMNSIYDIFNIFFSEHR